MAGGGTSDGNTLAQQAFIITMVCVALYIGFVVVFVLN